MLLILILFVISFFGYLLNKYWKRMQARTTLVLEIGNDHQSFTCRVKTLPLTPGFYRFTVNPQAVNIRLVEGFLSMKLGWSDGLNIINTTLDSAVQLPLYFNLHFWHLIRVRRIMNEPFYALLYILTVSNDLTDVVVLKRFHSPSAPVATVGGALHTAAVNLYPGEQLQQFK